MRSNRSFQRRPPLTRWLSRAVAFGGLTGVALVPLVAHAQTPEPSTDGRFAVVVEETVRGDLVLAGNSNLLRAGGWGPAATTSADVDGDRTNICIGRQGNRGAACADNSSSASVDVPAGASVIAARLYVSTAVSATVGPLRVRLAGPGNVFEYTELGGATPAAPKLAEVTAADAGGATLRQATWDITDFVSQGGGGNYTVADIVSERAAAWLPYASWSIVVAYEFDPDGDVDFAGLTPEAQQRFARRSISWHDGFALVADAPVEVEVGGFAIPTGGPVFAKSFHVIAHTGAASYENVLFDGGPLGNNVTPGDAAPPIGVVVGNDPSCNTIIDVVNDTVCSLGTPVASKIPGPLEYRSSADGATVTSGSAVDMDVMRIPDRYLVAGRTSAVLSVRPVGDGAVAAGVLAVSIDQPSPGVAP